VTLHTAYLLRDNDLYGEARVAYVVDRYRSLENRAEWALFGGSKLFRPNPHIDDGTMRSIATLAGFSTASKSRYGMEGWNVHATAEFAGAGLGGDFRFQQYIFDIRRYQPLGRFDNINLRFRAGTSHGSLPLQKTFELGGLGSLPAYRFKEFPGDTVGANRMLLMDAEYILNGDFLGDLSFWPSWLFRHVNLIFLADAGLVRTSSAKASPFSGFEGITWNELRSDAGVGIANRSGSMRLAAVWRTDRSEPARLLFRVEAPF
jgi:outer membrane protein assembly factor BamA